MTKQINKEMDNGSQIFYYKGPYSQENQNIVQGAIIYFEKNDWLQFYTDEKGSLDPKSIIPSGKTPMDIKNALNRFCSINNLEVQKKSPAGIYSYLAAKAAANF